VVFGTAL